MSNNKTAHIGVIGAGIAGLAAAIAIAEAGYQATIIGIMPQRMSGGLQLAPNGFQALAKLGLAEIIAPHTKRLDAIEIRSMTRPGLLATIDHETPVHRDYASLSRAGLMAALEQVTKQHHNIQFISDNVASLSVTASYANLTLEDGSQLSFDFLIGADGRGGLSRQFVNGAPVAQHHKASYCALRAVIPQTALPHIFHNPRTCLWLGNGFHLVTYPLADGMINLVLCLPDNQADNAMQLFHGHSLLSPLGQQPDAWHKTTLPATECLSVWRRHKLALIGDAAHFMPPHLAQGAGQTLEDAASLLASLQAHDNLDNAIADWAIERSRKLSPIVKRAQQTGEIMKLSGPLAKLRNIAVDFGGQKLIENWLRQVWQ